MRVLATAAGEAAAYPGLLAAIGELAGLRGLDVAARLRRGELRCARRGRRTRRRRRAGGVGVGVGVPVGRLRGAFAFPFRRPGRDGVLDRRPARSRRHMLATMESLGRRSPISSNAAAPQAVHAADARKSAILDSAFDCIITMDHEGHVSRSTRQRSRRSAARRGDDRPRAGRADHPAGLAHGHRRGRAGRAHRASSVEGHPLELRGHARRRHRFPVELIVTRPDWPGRRCSPATCATSPRRASARATCGGWPPSRRRCGAWRRRSPPTRTRARVRGRHRGGRAAARRASANMVRFDEERGRRSSAAGARAGPQRAGRQRRCAWTATPSPRGCSGRGRRRGSTTTTIEGLAGSLRESVPLRRGRAGLPRRPPVGRGDRLQRRTRRRSRTAPSSGSPTSPSSRRRRSPTRRRARSSRPRAPGSSQAGDAERRRLERNLHDGAQQRLVSLALMLRLAARRHPATMRELVRRRRGAAPRRCRSCASWPAASTRRC